MFAKIGERRFMRALSAVPSLAAACFLASCSPVATDELWGVWAICQEPEIVRVAHTFFVQRNDLDALPDMNCALFEYIRSPVRVIRCAVDVTPELMKDFYHRLPNDDSLPREICEVEIFYENGGSGIHYTYFLNIRKIR